MSYQLKSGFSLFLKNAVLCLFLALSLGILISALSSATQAFLRAYQDQERLGDYAPQNVVRFRTAVTGLALDDEMAFRRSLFPLFENNAVSVRQYMTLLTESETEFLITGDERLLPQQMRGTEEIRIFYSASSPPPFQTVEFLGKTIALQPVDERQLFFMTSYAYSDDEESPLYIYVPPALFSDPRYTTGLLGSRNITIYEEFISNARILKTDEGLIQTFLTATNNEFYNTISYMATNSETSFMLGFMAPYLGVASLVVILLLILVGALLLNQLQHSFAIHMLNGATSLEILLQFLVVLILIGVCGFTVAAFLLKWQLNQFFWFYLSASLLYGVFLIQALFQKLKPDRILQSVRNR